MPAAIQTTDDGKDDNSKGGDDDAGEKGLVQRLVFTKASASSADLMGSLQCGWVTTGRDQRTYQDHACIAPTTGFMAVVDLASRRRPSILGILCNESGRANRLRSWFGRPALSLWWFGRL